MTLCDAGPMVALVDKRDAHHARCVAALGTLPAGGLLTTWPCLAEAMYLLGEVGGWAFQDALWMYFARGVVRLHPPTGNEWERARALMRAYSDTPMDFADASLVAAAEGLNLRQVFTVDHHFHVYRQQQGHAFEVVP